jgi:hypothetical protein
MPPTFNTTLLPTITIDAQSPTWDTPTIINLVIGLITIALAMPGAMHALHTMRRGTILVSTSADTPSSRGVDLAPQARIKKAGF